MTLLRSKPKELEKLKESDQKKIPVKRDSYLTHNLTNPKELEEGASLKIVS